MTESADPTGLNREEAKQQRESGGRNYPFIPCAW